MPLHFATTMYAERIARQIRSSDADGGRVVKFLKTEEKSFKATRGRGDRSTHPTGRCVAVSVAGALFP